MERKLIQLVCSSIGIQTQGNRWPAGLLALVLLGAVPSFANTLTVSNTNDSGPGSLRDAIATAQSGDTIRFSVTGAITLTDGSLTVDKNLTIKGPGAAQLAISGDHNSPVFLIGSENPSAIIAISGLTIEGGGGGTVNSIGGGIYNEGTLTLTNAIVSGNSNAFYNSGGIYNSGTLTLVNCTVSANSAGVSGDGAGGGIFNLNMLSLVNSTVAGNEAYLGGGGIYNAGTAKLTNSTVSGNDAVFDGGIYNIATLTLENSTVTGNRAANPSGGITTSGALTMINSTVANNFSAYGGENGGIGIYGMGTFTAKSNVLAGNASDSNGGNCAFQGSVTSLGYNISDDDTCADFFTAAGDENSVTRGAGLDPKGLQNNGGPTQTIALLPGSPAVDHIPVPDCTDAQGQRVKTDQRGIRRPQGPACDTGAFELVQAVPFSNFTALLAIQTGQHSSFGLTARFTLGAASDGIAPLTEPVTLQIANYTVDLPAGSFHQLWNGTSAPHEYDGTINGTKLVVGIIPLGGRNYQLSAVGSPVAWTGVKNPVTVSLTVGNDSGSTSVKAFIDKP